MRGEPGSSPATARARAASALRRALPELAVRALGRTGCLAREAGGLPTRLDDPSRHVARAAETALHIHERRVAGALEQLTSVDRSHAGCAREHELRVLREVLF